MGAVHGYDVPHVDWLRGYHNMAMHPEQPLGLVDDGCCVHYVILYVCGTFRVLVVQMVNEL